jgi:hypothetical protein
VSGGKLDHAFEVWLVAETVRGRLRADVGSVCSGMVYDIAIAVDEPATSHWQKIKPQPSLRSSASGYFPR